jgi:hypothetical protein
MTEPITRIEAALSQLGREHEPPAGWEARVLAATAGPRRKPWWLFATSALAVAGAAAVIVTRVVPAEPAEPVAAFALEAPWDKGPATVRGDSLHVGDLVHATARGGGGYRSVWVYRNEELVAACPGGQACRFEGDKTIADVRLLSIGSYRIVALSSVVPLAPPRGVYDSDVANAFAQATYFEKLLPVR